MPCPMRIKPTTSREDAPAAGCGMSARETRHARCDHAVTRPMVSIASDDQDIERALRKNVMFAERAGTRLHPGLVIKCIEGRFSVEAPAVGVGETLIRLPLSCLLPVELFTLTVADDQIVLLSHDPTLSREQVALMEALLELYNVVGKLARHRYTSPWSLLASHPRLLTHIGQRLPNDLALMLDKFYRSGEADTLLLDSFLHSRSFSYPATEELPSYSVLMPIIDLVNHHRQGSPVRLEESADNGFLTIARSPPVPGAGNECFALYGLNDCFDTWMSYGFVDRRAPFVRSIPMTLELPEVGTLRLGNFVRIRRPGELPPQLSDLHLFVPEVLAKRRNYTELAALLFPPPNMPQALRRVLDFVIGEMNPAHPRRGELAAQAEAEIIAANRMYYADLLSILQTVRDHRYRAIVANFVRICELQLARIRDYGEDAGA